MDEQSVPAPPRTGPSPAGNSIGGQQAAAPKEFIGIMMKCCRTYVRAYLNPNGDAFIGR